MDVGQTNGGEHSMLLATVKSDLPSINAAAIWTEPEIVPKALEDPPTAISTPQPTPQKNEDIPINAHVPTPVELPMDIRVPDEMFLESPELVREEEKGASPPRLVPKDLLEQKLDNGDDRKSEAVNVLVSPADVINRFTRVMTPSLLAANEEMLSEDEEEEAMDGVHSPTQPTINSSKDSAITHESCSSGSHHSSPHYPGSDSELTTSGIVSSFNTESFLFDPSSRDCSESFSPDKPVVLPKHVAVVPSGVASFASNPVNMAENASSAPMNMSVQNFPKRHRHVQRAAVYAMHPYHRATCRGGAGVNVAKTLDLLKAVMQSSFNQEIKKLCDDYYQIYGMAAMNIQENTGDNVPPATLRLLVCKMMEEAMQGYQNNRWEFSSLQLPKNDRVSEYKESPMSTKKGRTEKETKHAVVGKRGRKPTEKAIDNRSAWKWSLDKRRLDPVKWSIDKLNPDTKFVLGVNVNKALGHAANRGKVYILHPQLFKYVCDGDDKTWLFENKYMPVHGGKAFLMIYEEVELLTKSDENYKENGDIYKSVQNLKRFTVPQFMLNKMKDFVKHVQGFFAQESASQSSSVATSQEIK